MGQSFYGSSGGYFVGSSVGMISQMELDRFEKMSVSGKTVSEKCASRVLAGWPL